MAKKIIKWVISKKIPETGPFVKKVFSPKFELSTLDKIDASGTLLSEPVSDPLNIYVQIKDYIKVKTGKVSGATLNIYKNMVEHLKAFEDDFRKKPITFECLDFDFYDRFAHYLMYDYEQSPLQKTDKRLKAKFDL